MECAKDVLTRLIAVDRGREPYAAVAERDRRWTAASSTWRSRFAAAIEPWQCTLTGETNDSDYRWVLDQRDARLRLLIADLAVRLHLCEQGKLPTDLRELVPRDLPAVPVDPFSGKPVVYRVEGDDFLVYCVGQDGKDDGGRFGTRIDTNMKPGLDWGLEFTDELGP
jgi:hypothetical protein